ncbi:MAG TPA: hypothetical protein VGI70_06545 [Polyangiales bacterium]|jgi:hypothetical protein
MQDAAQAFSDALEVERQAAMRADFDALLRVQEQKRALMPLVQTSAPPEVARELAERARRNLGLMRFLLSCLRGQLGLDAEPTYTARGQANEAVKSALRGRL